MPHGFWPTGYDYNSSAIQSCFFPQPHFQQEKTNSMLHSALITHSNSMLNGHRVPQHSQTKAING